MGRYDQNAKVYAKWAKEGRGQGQKENYKPWLYVYNVPSRGRSHRIWSYTSNRVVHCLSDLELSVFLLLEWSFVVEDIREQFPLDLNTTLSIASDLEFRHPMLRGEKIIMTTDFLASTPLKSEPYVLICITHVHALWVLLNSLGFLASSSRSGMGKPKTHCLMGYA